jgi:hypothetical protein
MSENTREPTVEEVNYRISTHGEMIDVPVDQLEWHPDTPLLIMNLDSNKSVSGYLAEIPMFGGVLKLKSTKDAPASIKRIIDVIELVWMQRNTREIMIFDSSDQNYYVCTVITPDIVDAASFDTYEGKQEAYFSMNPMTLFSTKEYEFMSMFFNAVAQAESLLSDYPEMGTLPVPIENEFVDRKELEWATRPREDREENSMPLSIFNTHRADEHSLSKEGKEALQTITYSRLRKTDGRIVLEEKRRSARSMIFILFPWIEVGK